MKINNLFGKKAHLLAPGLTAAMWFGCMGVVSAHEGEIEVSGVIEVEAAFGEDFAGSDSSDATLATVEIGIDSEISEGVMAHILLLHEEDDTPLEVDEGTITLMNLGGSPLYFTGGKMYVPFGNFESNMISDPLTLELGETRESVLQLGFESGGFYGSVYMFNGDIMKAGDDDTIEGTGINLGFTHENAVSYDVGFSYISNIADSDALQETVTDPLAVVDNVAGMGFYAIVNYDAFTFIAEHVAATDTFDAADLDFNGADAEPSSYNVEVAYGFDMSGMESTVALGFQGTDEALNLGLPKTTTLIALGMGIRENTTFSLEWRSDKDYDISDGGTGESADTITAQLAVEFGS